jgi:hypothetical protein
LGQHKISAAKSSFAPSYFEIVRFFSKYWQCEFSRQVSRKSLVIGQNSCSVPHHTTLLFVVRHSLWNPLLGRRQREVAHIFRITEPSRLVQDLVLSLSVWDRLKQRQKERVVFYFDRVPTQKVVNVPRKTAAGKRWALLNWYPYF